MGELSKFEYFPLFLKVCIQTGGVGFIYSALLAVPTPSFLCISDTSRKNTIGYSTIPLWLCIFLVLLLTPFLLLMAVSTTITILLFLVHVLPSIFVNFLLIIWFLAPHQPMIPSTIPTSIYLTFSRYVPVSYNNWKLFHIKTLLFPRYIHLYQKYLPTKTYCWFAPDSKIIQNFSWIYPPIKVSMLIKCGWVSIFTKHHAIIDNI